MRTIIICLFTAAAFAAAAQTIVKKNFPVTQGQKVEMHFDYPQLIRISTWDKSEISVEGKVSINGGEHDDAFKLGISTFGNVIEVESKIQDLKKLPERITIHKGSERITFKSQDDYEKYIDKHGRDFKSTSRGVDMDIVLEIKVPQNMETSIVSVYGMIEVKDFNAPLLAEATYGGIDAALVEKNTGELKAETNFGEIYSNLEQKFSGTESRDFHTVVSAKPGVGPSYNFESKYGNVYLRKR